MECNCGECDWKQCCKAFFFIMYDDDLDKYVERPYDRLDDAWKMLAVEIPADDKVHRFMCILQDVKGNCIIYPDTPSTCQLFTCDIDKVRSKR